MEEEEKTELLWVWSTHRPTPSPSESGTVLTSWASPSVSPLPTQGGSRAEKPGSARPGPSSSCSAWTGVVLSSKCTLTLTVSVPHEPATGRCGGRGGERARWG